MGNTSDCCMVISFTVRCMPRFCANLSFLFTESPFLARFEQAAAAGFSAVEFHYPYAHDPYAVRAALDAAGIEAALINVRAGDHTAGEWGFAGVPGRADTFKLCVDEALAYAEIIGVAQLNCLAGVRPTTASGHDCATTLVANLTFAAREAAKSGVAINLEPLNTVDVPGYLVANAAYARHVIELVGEPNLRLQYDWYHAAMMGIDVGNELAEVAPLAGHMQFADAPGRGEPGSGEIDFQTLFARLDELGYSGWLAAEYRPTKSTVSTLGWMRPANQPNPL